MGFDGGGGSQYGNFVGGIFIFNLIVGVGALSLPNAFAAAGFVPAIIFLCFLGFFGYMTVTFLLESISIANAFLGEKDKIESNPEAISINTIPYANPESDPSIPLLNTSSYTPYSLDKKVEIGQLSEIFLGPLGQILFFSTIIIYLMGDIAIYVTTIADALARVTGGWKIGSILFSDTDAYYVYVLGVLVLIAPLGFANFNSPYVKYLQFFTMGIRNLALVLMISLSIELIARHDNVPIKSVPFFRADVPAFFGAAIYAFMCHHSLPGIVAPMKNKLTVAKILAIDFIIIAAVYIILGTFAVFCFGTDLSSLYIYKFKDYHIKAFSIFLQLFPVFTISSNFPMLTITLRNNMITLVKLIMGPERVKKSEIMKDPPTWFRGFIFTISALAPGFIISMFDGRNVTLLVRLTGSYPGLGIMFAFPTVLVFYARRMKSQIHKGDSPNPYQSPFQHVAWLIIIGIWCVIALVLVTYNLISSIVHPSGGGGGH